MLVQLRNAWTNDDDVDDAESSWKNREGIVTFPQHTAGLSKGRR